MVNSILLRNENIVYDVSACDLLFTMLIPDYAADGRCFYDAKE